jgi:hypothetical protein
MSSAWWPATWWKAAGKGECAWADEGLSGVVRHRFASSVEHDVCWVGNEDRRG